MSAYLLIMKMPKNPGRFIHMFREKIIEMCIEMNEECVLDHVPGRFVLFSSEIICEKVRKMDRVIDCSPVLIFEDFETLVNHLLSRLGGCKSFAVRANHLHLAQEIGDQLYERTKIKVNLEAPDCEIKVEFRDKFYFLIE